MSIVEKAKSLGMAIVESNEYRELKTAETSMIEDGDAKTLLDNFNALQQRLQIAQQNGQQISPEQQKEIQGIQAQMQANEKIKVFMQAQEDFNKVMQTVNQTISAVLGEN